MSKNCQYLANGAAGVLAVTVLLTILKPLFFPGDGKVGQDLAIHEIKEAGGRVEIDASAPGKPVVRVDFEGLKKTDFMTFVPLGDDGLAHVRPYLESLPRLRYLRITSMAKITDDGLRHLEGLTQLETLELYSFWLSGRSITEVGVDSLRKKLPNVRITYFDSGPPRMPEMPLPQPEFRKDP